ncbi:MAG: S-adenosyl-l-methionine hydroxide adenosyltransferase family protein [Clostridiales bacterium]|nr:S-adenosyl-l-methionine hydroxide adenosyltransferase family protein [Clostridiales bacterium]
MRKTLVFQSDFGLVDGAVAAMYGVSLGVDESLRLFDLTHEIQPYNIWEASYRLYQAVQFWPEGTVFVSVIDPGVGSDRKSVVAKTKLGHYIVTPDNGTLTHLKLYVGITEVRTINEGLHMRSTVGGSHTFHGRDLYANTGAKLASGLIDFEAVGPAIATSEIVELPVDKVIVEEKRIIGSIDTLDLRFGSLWTSITQEDFAKLGFQYGDRVEVAIRHDHSLVYNNRVTYGKSFADVFVSEQILYVNSLYRMAVAINQGNFAKAYSIGMGRQWTIELIKG